MIRTGDASVYAFLGELEAEAKVDAQAFGGNGNSYKGAAIDKLTRNWLPQHRSGDSMLLEDWNLLTARVSDLIRNEPSLKKAKADLVKHIVGIGIQSFADVVDDAGEYFDEFNDEADEAFERWSEEEADVEGRRAWQDFQTDGYAQTIEHGEAIFLKCFDDTPGRSVPYCLQLLEAAQLDESKNEDWGTNRNRIVRGVELDRRNRPVAYWIFDAHPWDRYSGWSSESTRIPAERVLHHYIPMPTSATRGMSWFHALVRVTRDVDWMLGNELTAGALQALLVAIHKADIVNTGTGIGTGILDGQPSVDEFGNSLFKLGRGTVARIGKEESIELVESKRPGPQMKPTMQLMRQEQAMGANLAYTTLTGDFAATSFTSAHGAMNEENAYFRPLQRRCARSLIKPVRREHLVHAVAYGQLRTLTAAQYREQPTRWRRVLAQPPGRDMLNPLDQSEAANSRMRGGQTTLADECGATGRNWRQTLRMKARIEREARRLGTSVDWSKGGGEPSTADNRDAQAIGETTEASDVEA